MNDKQWAGVLLSGLLVLGGGWYYLRQQPAEQAAAPAAPVLAEAAPVPQAPSAPPPAADYPLPAPAADAPALPALGDSDEALRSALSALIGESAFAAFLVPDRLIRRIVVTLDNLPRDRVSLELRALRRTPPPFLVVRDGERLTVSPANAERYAAVVRAFTAVDPAALVALYVRWYPLFQRAYVELGYPDRSFNNRLVEVLDHLLATPPPPADLALRQPRVVYEYADAQLEARSAGQRMLLRLDPAQRAAVMQQLAALRRAVVDAGLRAGAG